MSEWPSDLTYRPIVAWPGEPTAKRIKSPFSLSITRIRDELRRELRLHGARSAVLQVALREGQFRIDGMPYANAIVEHPGVILSFDTKGGALTFPCDTFRSWEDNLLAIVRTMNALRMADRYGVTKRGEQYAGWRAIAAGPSSTISTVEEALAVIQGYVLPGVVIADLPRAVRLAKREAHPDRGGDPEDFHRVTAAEEFLRAHGNL